MHPDLLEAQHYAYEPSGFTCKNLVQEAEGREYGACLFELNNKIIQFRVAKITPTKLGQFVTLWKRIGDGPILPYDLSDPIDFFIVSVRTPEHFGQFIFPKSALYAQGFVGKEGSGGKRAMRVYPPWDRPDSQQAQKTQAWQAKYFFEIMSSTSINKTVVQGLFT